MKKKEIENILGGYCLNGFVEFEWDLSETNYIFGERRNEGVERWRFGLFLDFQAMVGGGVRWPEVVRRRFSGFSGGL